MYRFVTEISLSAPAVRVWETLSDVGTWEAWWRWLDHAEVVEEGAESGLGLRVRHEVATPLLYRLRYEGVVTDVRPGRRAGLAVSGDLQGRARFALEPTAGESSLTFDWQVVPARRWMRLTSPVARKLFSRAHERVMADFAEGLAAATGAELRSYRSRELPP